MPGARRRSRSSWSPSSSRPSDVDLLVDLGVDDIGENRDQEASAKVAELAHRDRLRVHFVGQLQSNKAASVAHYADVVQSVDRAKLARALDRAARTGRRPRRDRAGRARRRAEGGAASPPRRRRPSRTSSPGRPRCGCAASWRWLRSAPTPDPRSPACARSADGIRADHPDATWVSAGMSGDLEAALAEGATHLRVGSAILGSRPSHR